MSVHLVGGGWVPESYSRVYGPFVTEAVRHAAQNGRTAARVGVLLVYEADLDEGRARAGQFAEILAGLGPVEAAVVLVREGDVCPAGRLDDLDGLLVAGGLTPAYLTAVTPVADEVRRLVAGGAPYLGFSAGAAVAARRAVVGGWRIGGLSIANEDSAEDLDQLTVADGLGLVDFAVDVHAAQWGNVTRLIMAVSSGAVDRGVAVDESTVYTVDGAAVTVAGAGQVWEVTRAEPGVRIQTVRDQQSLPSTG